MYEYRVGELYSPNRTRWPEAIEYNFRDGAHELRVFFADITAREKRAVTEQTFDLALTAVGPVIFMLTRFAYDHDWNDSPYTVHLVPDEQRQSPPELEPDQGVLLHIILVEATTGTIAGLRVVSMPPAFTRTLHSMIRQQEREPFDEASYDRALVDAYRRYPTAVDLAAVAVARARFERRK